MGDFWPFLGWFIGDFAILRGFVFKGAFLKNNIISGFLVRGERERERQRERERERNVKCSV